MVVADEEEGVEDRKEKRIRKYISYISHKIERAVKKRALKQNRSIKIWKYVISRS
tara:strand:+ start:780 stop:944 length:165 start_codon:yes stop_codon:yes gene_type:complete